MPRLTTRCTASVARAASIPRGLPVSCEKSAGVVGSTATAKSATTERRMRHPAICLSMSSRPAPAAVANGGGVHRFGIADSSRRSAHRGSIGRSTIRLRTRRKTLATED